MHDRCLYEYAVIRVVPRVDREEFLNVGIILSSQSQDFLEARIELDEHRLLALDPQIDLEPVRTHLNSIPAICKGGVSAEQIGRLSLRERFHWLVAPRSTVIQTSAVHTGRSIDLSRTLEHLLDSMVRPAHVSR